MSLDLPTGAVTFLFTDIEGSSQLWERYPEAMKLALAGHDRALREAVESHGGHIVKTTGDGCHAVFASPLGAVLAAVATQRHMTTAERQLAGDEAPSASAIRHPSSVDLKVRIGFHTGEAELREGDYYGPAVNRAARIMSIGHGGQVLMSGITAALLQGLLPPDVSLLDLGDHRLKGLSRPERVYQLVAPDLSAEFPALLSESAARGNLPEPLTSFVGRERELAETQALLSEARLLTLTGSGGTGKTRLSLELGRRVRDEYDHGVWLVELAPLTDPGLVPSAVASVLELVEQPGLPLLTALMDYLRGKELLLILDNCEHLVEACARLAADLLAAAPRLTILASSREGLGAAGEITYHLPVLSAPPRDATTMEAVADYEAVRLFVARASAAQPGFALTRRNAAIVGQIVRRLDGIPLAIELAAARIKLLPPEQLAARLDDRFRLLTGGSRTSLPRQQTLRALIDWSYDLLDEHEQWFFRQLGVFVGGWTLEAAEFVADLSGFGNQTGLAAFDLLANLVNKSMAEVTEEAGAARFRMLETIRQYARDKLFETGETVPARERHLNYFARMVVEGGPAIANVNSVRLFSGMTSLSFADWLDRVLVDLDNIRAAFAWAMETDPERALALALDMTGASVQVAGMEEILEWLRVAREHVEDLPAAEGEAAERRALLMAGSLLMTGNLLIGVGQADQALVALERAAALARAHDFRPMLAYVMDSLASAGVLTGHPDAYDWAQESVTIFEELNYPPGRGMPLALMAQAKAIEGDLVQAARLLDEAKQALQVSENTITGGLAALALAMTSAALGNLDEAIAILEQAVIIFRRQGGKSFALGAKNTIGHLERRRGREDVAEAIFLETIQEFRNLGLRKFIIGQLEILGIIAAHRGLAERAAMLLGAAEALREQIGAAIWYRELPEPEFEAELAALRAAVHPAVFHAAWNTGRALDLDAAVDLAVATNRSSPVE